MKRKVVEKICKLQLIKKYFYKVSGKHMKTHRKYKNIKICLNNVIFVHIWDINIKIFV